MASGLRALVRNWPLAVVLSLAAVAHSYNMFGVPFYDVDEGANFFRVWGVINMGRLDPYTYWYDHPPLAWVVMAPPATLLTRLGLFDMTIDAGRVLMLVFHLLATWLLFQIVKRLTSSTLAATGAGLALALSPVGIYFQRRIELDNVATFWILLALYLALKPQPALRWVALGGLCMAIAVLSKEPALLFAPAVIYTVGQRVDRQRRVMAVAIWLGIFVLVGSIYPLYALLKGELFPTGSLLGGTNPHVSLFGTLAQGRTVGGAELWGTIQVAWWGRDPILLGTGVLAVLLNLVPAVRQPSARIAVLLAGPYLLVLSRGEARDYWIVPLLPALIINIVVAGAVARTWLRTRPRAVPTDRSRRFRRSAPLYAWNRRIMGGLLLGALLSPVILFTPTYLADYAAQFTHLFRDDQTAAEREADRWIKAHIDPTAVLVIDSYLWAELRDTTRQATDPPGLAAGRLYNHADYYWNVEKDPEIRDGKLKADWHNVDYVVVTPQLQFYADQGTVPFVKTILDHATTVARFTSGGYWVKIEKLVKTGTANDGAGVEPASEH